MQVPFVRVLGWPGSAGDGKPFDAWRRRRSGAGWQNRRAGLVGQVGEICPISWDKVYFDNDIYRLRNGEIMDISGYIDTTLQAINSKNTHRAYKRCFQRFEDWYSAAEGDLNFDHSLVLDFMSWLEVSNEDEPRKPQYYIQHLAAIKRLSKTMADNRVIDLYEAMVIRGIEPPKIQTVVSGNMVSEKDMKTMLKTCIEDGDIGVRDAAILSMLHSTGIRRSEAAFLHTSNVSGNQITVRETKNNQDRMAYLNKGAQGYLSGWMAIRGNEPGYVFLKFKKQKNEYRMTDEGINPQLIYWILNYRIKQSGIETPYTPHDFRKTFISTLLNKGNDPMAIAHLSGHKSTDTIRKYDLTVSERAKKSAKDIYTPGLDELD